MCSKEGFPIFLEVKNYASEGRNLQLSLGLSFVENFQILSMEKEDYNKPSTDSQKQPQVSIEFYLKVSFRKKLKHSFTRNNYQEPFN